MISPFDVAASPPLPSVVLPKVSGVLSTTVAPEPLTPTEPVNALAGLLNDTVPVDGLAAAVVLPPTFNGPLCVMLPPVLVAARSPLGALS